MFWLLFFFFKKYLQKTLVAKRNRGERIKIIKLEDRIRRGYMPIYVWCVQVWWWMEMSAFVCKGEALFRANESLEGGFFLFFQEKFKARAFGVRAKTGVLAKTKRTRRPYTYCLILFIIWPYNKPSRYTTSLSLIINEMPEFISNYYEICVNNF